MVICGVVESAWDVCRQLEGNGPLVVSCIDGAMALQGQLFLQSSSQHNIPAQSRKSASKVSNSNPVIANIHVRCAAWQQHVAEAAETLAPERQLLLQAAVSTLPPHCRVAKD